MTEFARAYGSGDVDGLVALFTDDVFVSMPPIPLEHQGRDVVAGLFAGIFRSGRRVDLAPTRANGQPAFGTYLRSPAGIRHGTGIRHGSGLFVLTLTGLRIRAFTRVDNSVLPWFGLPRSLPGR
ncbi:nuclear transport factor 2 family protein [Streptomyces shaanxiensis]|uniref:SnoaL-like domain-containing protein n=1 Tax=Streptomyces shaanxiensis TaxID=653357 RepID=A0ABP7W9J4_9ACTN